MVVERTGFAGAPVQHSISLWHASRYHKDTLMQTVNWWERERPDSRHGMNPLIRTEEESCHCTDIRVCASNISEQVQVFFYHEMCCIWILTRYFLSKSEGKLTFCGVLTLTHNVYRNNLWHFHRNFTLYCSLHNSNHIQRIKSFTFVILNFQCLVVNSSGTGKRCAHKQWLLKRTEKNPANMSGWSTFIILINCINLVYCLSWLHVLTDQWQCFHWPSLSSCIRPVVAHWPFLLKFLFIYN